ncbi:radical SAM protein [Pseudodesulfovibrio sediminis]|uniref:Radical SAM core domain-containing protein n=1 Tax=Pseudodesulfovibrio sediminis TaxID=2810563 RepID=A0ABN6EVU3_9BACT|nr:radical SAM protein [Pseudodesulfovibrio sediminis]BCS89184.1 hypothetical protein PSDVSF_24260 [Pseudodesulfovibrio sediminis]
MNCRMTRGIYMRANGELNCFCSTGEQVTLGKLGDADDGSDFIKDIYMGKRFERIRTSMERDILPFPRQCMKCNYLQPKDNYDPAATSKTIEWMHIETSALCNLRCPFCVHGVTGDRKPHRPKPYFLPRENWVKMLDDIKNAGLAVQWMYFSGRGEPTLHPEVWEMVQDAKTRFDTNFLMNTNGNTPFNPLIVKSGLDKIKIAIDSLDQDTYAKYRIGGKVKTMLDLTRGIAEYKAKLNVQSPTIIWQKVLFDFNSSPEEIYEYQKKAQECGVDRIRLFFTWTKGFSTHTPDDYDLFFPDIEIHNPYQKGLISADQMDLDRQNSVSSKSVPGLIKVLSDFMHWVELGTEDRIDYDRFAVLNLHSKELLSLRQDEVEGPKHLAVYRKSIRDLANLYQDLGQPGQACQYNGIADRIDS